VDWGCQWCPVFMQFAAGPPYKPYWFGEEYAQAEIKPDKLDEG